MKKCKIWLLSLVLWTLGCVTTMAQFTNIKAGVQRSTFLSTYPVVSVESRIGERLTFQPEFGFFRNTRMYRGVVLATHQVHFGLEGRGYLLLRQGRYFTGLYTGAFVTHDRLPFLIQGYPRAAVQRYCTNIGITLGYQQSIFQHFQVDCGIKIGYSNRIIDKEYDAAGGLVRSFERKGHFAGYLYLQVGYAF